MLAMPPMMLALLFATQSFEPLPEPEVPVDEPGGLAACPPVMVPFVTPAPRPFSPGVDTYFVYPQEGDSDVPRNVVLRLAGFLGSFDVTPPTLEVVLSTADGAQVFETVREGVEVRPLAPLPSNMQLDARIVPTTDHPCPECVVPFAMAFSTGSAVDSTPPRLDDASLQAWARPLSCGITTNGLAYVDIRHQDDDIVSVEVGVRLGGSPAQPVRAFAVAPGERRTVRIRSLPAMRVTPETLLRVALTPVDHAGHRGAPLILRTAIQPAPMSGRLEDIPGGCRAPGASEVATYGAVAPGDRIMVRHPFQRVPLGLRRDSGEIIALGERIEDTAAGEALVVSSEVEAGGYDLVALPCPQCVCSECAAVYPQRIDVVAPRDGADPAAPVVRAVVPLVPNAPSAGGGVCRDEPRGFYVEIEAGEDDADPPEALRYHLAVRQGGAPGVVVGRFVEPLQRPSGTWVVGAQNMSDLTDLFSTTFDLEVRALDRSGRATLQTVNVPAAGGCAHVRSSSARPTAWGALILIASALARRRRRSC